jgi:hypothetical protein
MYSFHPINNYFSFEIKKEKLVLALVAPADKGTIVGPFLSAL